MSNDDKASANSPLQARREEERAERRDEILDAAEAVVAKEGWEHTTYGGIAKRARLSRSLVYVYFPERDDLFNALCTRGMKVLEERFGEAMAGHRLGIDQVDAIGRAYHRFSQDEPLYFEIVAHEHTRPWESEATGNNAEVRERGRGCLMTVVNALVNGLKDGSVRSDIGDPAKTAIAIWAFTHGLIQISSRKEVMLKEEFKVSAADNMEHGFQFLRRSLSVKI